MNSLVFSKNHFTCKGEIDLYILKKNHRGNKIILSPGKCFFSACNFLKAEN